MTSTTRRKKNQILTALLVAVGIGQVAFAWNVKDIRPELGYVPTPPSAEFIDGLALGDRQFLFRILALTIQNSGDTFGRFSPLKLYNYEDLRSWLYLQDILDPKSDYMPSLAAYYFSQTQTVADISYLVDYLYDHAKQDVTNKWWWLMQTIYLANHKLKNPDLALEVAKPLRNSELPVMAQQLLAIVHEQRGEIDQAFDIIKEIQRNVEDIPDKELRYMNYFAEERLKRLEEYKEELDRLGKPFVPNNSPSTPQSSESGAS